jgi:hypothetical protein
VGELEDMGPMMDSLRIQEYMGIGSLFSSQVASQTHSKNKSLSGFAEVLAGIQDLLPALERQANIVKQYPP